MRCRITYILLVGCWSVWGQSVSSFTKDFGKVKEWNNPIFEVLYTNTSGKVQYFLPTVYQRDMLVDFDKKKLSPGESTTIQFQYFTEDFGRFQKTVSVYISSQNEPLEFSVKGNIVSFRPDAFTFCPRVDNKNLQDVPYFNHLVRVIDANTKLPLTDYELDIITAVSQESIHSNKSKYTLRREKPGLYSFSVDKEGYELQSLEIYVNKNTKETVIALVPEPKEEEILASSDKPDEDESNIVDDFFRRNSDNDNSENTEQSHTTEEPSAPIEPKQGDIVLDDEPKDTKEEEVVVAEKKPVEHKDTSMVIQNTPEVAKPVIVAEPKDTADYSSDGKLNSSKYTFNNIVFLIDVSTSMRNPEKLPLLKESMLQMIKILREDDKVSIITYSTKAEILINNASGSHKEALYEIVNKLEARGQSYGQEGVDMAYKLAKKLHIQEGNNEIILASDGVFNSKKFSESKIYRQARIQFAAYDIRMSTIGFGKTSRALTFLQTLASKGNGSYIVIQGKEEAESILIQNLMRHSRVHQ